MPPRARVNLNELAPPRAASGYAWDERARTAKSGEVTAHFGDIASAVEAFINGSDMLVGCVAWVKSPRLIDALAQRPVALVVNKEFGLRIDGHREREPLLRLSGGVPARFLPPPSKGTGKLDPVRCAGWAVRGKFGALMHHKFLVRLDAGGKPVAVWTGSFNLTTGAESNLENGLVITDPVIAAAFLAEFSRVWALSEPLTFREGRPSPGSSAAALRPARAKAARKKKTTRKKPTARKAAAKKKTATVTAAKKKKKTAAAKKGSN